MRTYTPKREFPYKLPRNVYYDNINDIMGKHVEEMEAKDVLHLLRAGLIDCYFEQNKDAIKEGRFDDVIPTLADLGHVLDESDTSGIALQIVRALIGSMPVPPVGEVKKERGEIDYKSLHSALVDVVKISEETFWGSTLRELCERWETYLVVTGKAEPTPEVQLFDD